MTHPDQTGQGGVRPVPSGPDESLVNVPLTHFHLSRFLVCYKTGLQIIRFKIFLFFCSDNSFSDRAVHGEDHSVFTGFGIKVHAAVSFYSGLLYGVFSV